MEKQKEVIWEKELKPINGFLMLLVVIIGFIVSTVAFFGGAISVDPYNELVGGIVLMFGMLGWALFGTMCAGFKIVKPIEARVFTLFGKYYGTVKQAGFFFVNPFCVTFSPTYLAAKAETARKAKEAEAQGKPNTTTAPTKAISLKIQTIDNQRQKVNDILGNPIIIGAVVIWYVDDPTQAVFAVENYYDFLRIQTDSTIRNVARLYPYDIFTEDDEADSEQEKTLRGSALEIADMMTMELQRRVENAGLVIKEVRITHLAYAEEIAAAMLQRQQASAIIAARKKIVDGAVGMVKMALDKLGEDNIVILDDERKSAMVSNLLVVLCGNRDAQPIINSGSIF